MIRLRAEKKSLEGLARPRNKKLSTPLPTRTDSLSEADSHVILTLQQSSNFPEQLASKVDDMTTRLESTIDVFADGLHRVNQYQKHADAVANRVLALCSNKLAERDKSERQQALGDTESPGRSLSGVLRGLSKSAS